MVAEMLDAGESAIDAAVERPAYCPSPTAGLQDVTGTPASPYFVHHPASSPPVHTIVFVPGADGSHSITINFIWPLWLANGGGRDEVRILIPYTSDGDIRDERDRFAEVARESLLCFDGDPAHVHLAGTSNGGLAAFRAMLDHSETFATLLGAPGAFEISPTDDALRAAFTGKAVFLGTGELDDASWRGAASALDQRLIDLGLDSRLVEFEGQGHILDEVFDETVFYDFWRSH